VDRIVAVLKQAELDVRIELVSRVLGAYHPVSLYIFKARMTHCTLCGADCIAGVS
jgi:hypothetical protein